MTRRGFSLIEVMLGGALFVITLGLSHALFTSAHRGEARDTRRSLAAFHAAETLEQILLVHGFKGDLPLWGRVHAPVPFDDPGPRGRTLMSCLGGQAFSTPITEGMERLVSITALRTGAGGALLRPDRAYRIEVLVRYPGPVGERREVRLVTVRSRNVVQRPRLADEDTP